MFTVKYTNDETFEMYIDGKYIGMADHGMNGWDGMSYHRTVFKRIATTLGHDYEEEGTPCV